MQNLLVQAARQQSTKFELLWPLMVKLGQGGGEGWRRVEEGAVGGEERGICANQNKIKYACRTLDSIELSYQCCNVSFLWPGLSGFS